MRTVKTTLLPESRNKSVYFDAEEAIGIYEKDTGKLTSRKLWMAVALFVSGLITAFGGEAGVAETVSGCLMQGGAVIAYVLAEGWADAGNAE